MTLTSTWLLEMTKEADKTFGKLDKPIKQRIINFFEIRVLKSENPRKFGKPLTGNLKSLRSYRIGDFRVLVDIQDKRMTIVAVNIAHRREVYDYDKGL